MMGGASRRMRGPRPLPPGAEGAVGFAEDPRTCSIGDLEKLDCGYQHITPVQCEARGCCYRPVTTRAVPFCYHTAEQGTDPCADFNHVHLQNVVHNDLGGPRGLVIKCVDQLPRADTLNSRRLVSWDGGREVDLKVYAATPYQSAGASENGFDAKAPYYAKITVDAGTNVSLTLGVYARRTDTLLALSDIYWTFLDLDTGADGTGVESLTIADYTEASVSATTELQVRRNADKSATFTASTEGTADDNPTQPLELTRRQKDRGVTFFFKYFAGMRVTLAASPGSATRDFLLVGRPSLLCIRPSDTEGQYTLLENGADSCDPGMQVSSRTACEGAIASLGREAAPSVVAHSSDMPPYCSYSVEGPPYMHFNTNPKGQGRADLAPVCVKQDTVVVQTTNLCCFVKIFSLELFCREDKTWWTFYCRKE